ncbi:unnamed protein product [Meloidogyne enterolobii]|uniref:Uncharacterized protein n=1 Tax=Meloidogyne enterolobii TaxID=390850 RepID=A0ACB0ZT23_MELEN
MKLESFLIVLFFNWMLWTFVKTIPIRKSLAKHAEKDYTSNDVNKILNDGAESSVNPQIRKSKEMLKPKLKITKKDTDKGEGKVFNQMEYNKEYYQKNKEKLNENMRNYREQNKVKIIEQKRNYKSITNKDKKNKYNSIYYQKNKERIQKNKKIYCQKNKEKIRNRKKIYYQNNKGKLKEYQRKYKQRKKNNQSNNDEGTSFVNPRAEDFSNLVKLANVCEEEWNLFNQREEEYNNGEENQIEVEDPNKMHG